MTIHAVAAPKTMTIKARTSIYLKKRLSYLESHPRSTSVDNNNNSIRQLKEERKLWRFL